MLYLTSCNYEEYYRKAKYELSEMDLTGIDIYPRLLKKYDELLDSYSYNLYRVEKGIEPIGNNEDIELYDIILNKNKQIKDLKSQNRNLIKENKKLKKQINKLENGYEDILKSKSWRITSIFRKLRYI